MSSRRVSKLFLKPAHGAGMVSVQNIELAHGGVVGDVSRSSSSPRQVLLARNEDINHFGLPPGYLRENILLTGLTSTEFKPGQMVNFVSGASIHLVFYCEPCQKIGERVPRLSELIHRRGILGIVTQEGPMEEGDEFTICQSSFNPMSDKAQDRVHQVIAAIPKGSVIDYSTLLHASGLQRPYFRVIPKYLQSALAEGLPAHRVVENLT